MHSDEGTITQLLDEWSRGDSGALDKLMPLVVDDLREIARRCLSHEPTRVTLQPTDLVSEVYLRLAGKRKVQWKNSGQFFMEMTHVVRRILVDHARTRKRIKRGGGQRSLPLESVFDLAEITPDELMALGDALHSLEKLDEEQSLIVHLRFFVGLTMAEIAELLDISERTVKRKWLTAKLWLYREISDG